MSIDPAQLLKSALEHPYRPDHCFVCAVPLSEGSRTAEHVLPKWLQGRFNLWGQELVLINGTAIRYEQLKIQCCFECNNTRLSPLENRISAAVADGYDALMQLPRFDLFRWMAKIYLGIMCKELSLLADRTNPTLGTILTSEFVRRYAMLHFWLQMTSGNADVQYSPGSLWVFRCQVPDNVDEQFDLKDHLTNGVLALRIGHIAIIADFLENGVHQQLNAEATRLIANIPLHPMQFSELVARIVYESGLLCQRSEVEFVQHGEKVGYNIRWWSTVDGNSPLKPRDPADFAAVLSYYTEVPIEFLFRPPGFIKTWLQHPNGDFLYWALGQPHPYAVPSPEGTV